MDTVIPEYQYSVLMSVYKNDKPTYVHQAIESMMNQTVKPEQFVIVEDGPLDVEVEDIISQYEKTHPSCFTIIRLERNGGLGNALNHGLKACRNELVARMDSDDISQPQRCEKQLIRFTEVDDLAILGTQLIEFIGSTDNIVPSRTVPCSYEEIKKFARRRSPFNHPTVMYKKSVIEKLDGYTPYKRKEDLDLFIRAVNEGYYVENLPDYLLFYRTSEDNLARRKTWINCKENIQIMYSFYKKGYCGIADLMYVTVGQMAMFIMPTFIAQALSNKFLRTRVNTENSRMS